MNLLDKITGSMTAQEQRGRGPGRERFHKSMSDPEEAPRDPEEELGTTSGGGECSRFGQLTNRCAKCAPERRCVKLLTGFFSSCGVGRGDEYSDEAEKLQRADDDKEKNDSRKRCEEVRGEEKRQKAIIAAKELVYLHNAATSALRFSPYTTV